MDSSGIYSTRTAYKFMLGEIRGESEDGSFSLLWRLKIPPKAKVFTWRLIKERSPTNMNLRGRQVEIADPLCPFWNNLDEDAAHLFFNCSKVLPLWWETVSWVKSVGAFPKEPKDHFMHHSKSNATRTRLFVSLEVGEGITCLMREAVRKNFYSSYRVGMKNEPTNILQYADDTDNVLVLKVMLRGYEMVSGLKINYAKSQFGVIGGVVTWTNEAAQTLNCRQLETPFTYLGIPIGAKPSSSVSARVQGGHSYWRRDLRKLYHQSDQSIFQQCMSWKVGCGDKVSFWKDKWLGEGPTLQQKYNQLFLINRQQPDLISMIGNFSQDNWRWDLKWRRNLFDHESDLAVNFMEEISSIHIQRHVKDIMTWKADPSGVYSTKSAYKLMITPSTPTSELRSSTLLWKLKIPPKAAVFTWRLLKDRLPTRANLIRGNVIIQDTVCPLCGLEQKEVGNLFFNCKRIVGLWWESMTWVQAQGTLPASPVDHFPMVGFWRAAPEVLCNIFFQYLLYCF
ncbi:putative ribonuclease H protein [Glycine soja]